MSAYLVDDEHIHVLLHAAVYRWPGQVDLYWPTKEQPSLVNAVGGTGTGRSCGG